MTYDAAIHTLALVAALLGASALYQAIKRTY